MADFGTDRVVGPLHMLPAALIECSGVPSHSLRVKGCSKIDSVVLDQHVVYTNLEGKIGAESLRKQLQGLFPRQCSPFLRVWEEPLGLLYSAGQDRLSDMARSSLVGYVGCLGVSK